MSSDEIKRWEQQENETAKAYSAFKIYLEMEDRSIPKVAQMLSVSTANIKRWSKKNQWLERAKAYDSSIVEETRKIQIKNRQKDIAEQRKISQLLKKAAIEILINANPKKGSYYAATQLADLGCRLANEAFEMEVSTDESAQITSITIKRRGE